jgi:DNA-binding transcriptional LysR family regulator
VRLSPPGEAFLHHARAMLEQTRQLQADLQEYGAGLRGHVRVFANTTAVTEFMPDILAAYLMQHPHISVDLQERPNAHIAHDIREGRADLGIIAGEVDTHGLTSLHFSTDRLVLVTPDTPAWRSHQQIAFAQVLHEHFVGMHRHSTLQTFWTRSASSWATHRLRIQLSNFDAMCRMVAAGVGGRGAGKCGAAPPQPEPAAPRAAAGCLGRAPALHAAARRADALPPCAGPDGCHPGLPPAPARAASGWCAAG